MTVLPDIRQIQLITGVSIVGYIVEETEHTLHVETPFEIIRSGNTAEWAVYLHMCDDNHVVGIKKDHIICSFECDFHFKYEYIKMMKRLTHDDFDTPDDLTVDDLTVDDLTVDDLTVDDLHEDDTDEDIYNTNNKYLH